MTECVHCHKVIRETEESFAVLFKVAPRPVYVHTRCCDAGARHYGSEAAYENRVREVLSTRQEKAPTSE